MMMFCKESTLVAALALAACLPQSTGAIEPKDGETIRQEQQFPFGPAGDSMVANYYLTNANVGILGTGLSVVPGTPYITVINDFDPNFNLFALSSGTFTDGLAGGLVPVEYSTGPPQVMIQTVGGIGIEKGVCLCTGRVERLEPAPPFFDDGFGVRGPNDAQPENGGSFPEPATASKTFLIDEVSIPNWIPQDDYGDPDLAADSNVPVQMTQDRCALEFEVTTTEPGYIQLTIVYGTDEYPEWIEPGDPDEVFDDTFGVFIHPIGNENAKVNIAKFRNATSPQTPMPFSPFDAQSCTQLVTENQSYPISQLMNPNADYYNHEYDLFTRKMMLESPTVLGPGQYRIKIVIHDVGEIQQAGGGTVPDNLVDSAIFIEEGSLKLNTAPLIEGDYNGNGEVEQGDMDLVFLNWGQPAVPRPASWVNDLPTGTIDQDELDGVTLNWGNEEWRADVDRDGDVDGDDLLIVLLHFGQTSCVTRTMGDANDDGKIDRDDQDIWEAEVGGGVGGAFEYLLMEAASYCQFPPQPMPGPGPAPPGPFPGPVPPPQGPAPAPGLSGDPAPQPAPAAGGQASPPTSPQPTAPGQPNVQTAASSDDSTDRTASQPAAAQAEPIYTGPSPQPSSRATGHDRIAAIRELTGIAYAEWAEGDKWFAEEMWKSIGRTYGEYVLHDSVLQILAK